MKIISVRENSLSSSVIHSHRKKDYIFNKQNNNNDSSTQLCVNFSQDHGIIVNSIILSIAVYYVLHQGPMPLFLLFSVGLLIDWLHSIARLTQFDLLLNP